MFICRKKEGCYGGMYTIPGSLDREGTMIEKRRFKEQSFRKRDIFRFYLDMLHLGRRRDVFRLMT